MPDCALPESLKETSGMCKYGRNLKYLKCSPWRGRGDMRRANTGLAASRFVWDSPASSSPPLTLLALEHPWEERVTSSKVYNLVLKKNKFPFLDGIHCVVKLLLWGGCGGWYCLWGSCQTYSAMPLAEHT